MQINEKITKIAQTKYPLCNKVESVVLTEKEILKSIQEHKLISKAFIHPKEGHVLALFIDREGKVRRRFCFYIVENENKNITIKSNPPMENLGKIFDQMIHNSKKLKQVIHNLNEIKIN